MKIPCYVTVEEVKRVCKELKISDWTQKKESKESLDYYKLLEVAELEGDLVMAVARGRSKKIREYYGRLAKARIALRKAELEWLE